MSYQPKNPNGQATKANSAPVVIASDQGAVTVDGSGVTQPVSAASLPLPSGASTSVKQDTGNTSLSSIDGKITAVNTGAVTVSSSALPTGAATAAKQPALGTAGTASADVITVQGKASMTPLLIDGSATTQPISGTVTANAGTNLNTSALATSTNITGGSQKTQVVDGSGNVIGATSNALDVNIKSGSSSGTQYADGAVRGTATGTIAMVDDGTNIQSSKGDTDGTLNNNTTKLGGTAIDTNSGSKSGGTQRVVLATDQPALTNALKTDSSATTQPVSAASLPLPAGASTAAKQPALGTAGSASSDVLTVQGITSMTALKVDGSGVTQPVSGTVTANAGTNLNTSALALDATLTGGTQKTKLVDTGGTNVGSISAGGALKVDNSGVTQPVSGTVTANAGTNLNTSSLALETGGNLATIAGAITASVVQGNVKQINGVTPLMGNGATGTGSQRVTIASDNTAFSTNANQGTAAAITAGWPVIGGELADTTGTFTNATQTTSVTTTSFDGYSTVIVSINGTYGTATGVFEVSDDGGTTWYSVNAARTDGSAVETGYTTLTNTNRMWTLSVSGADEFRVRSTAVASGTVNVRISVESMPTPEAASVTIPGTVAVTQSGTWSDTVTQATAASLNATVVGTGTFAVQTTSDTPGTGATNLGKAEDAAHASGDTGVFALAVRNDNLGTTYTNADQDYSPVAVDLNGRVMVAQKAATATLSNVAGSATTVTLLAANASRIGATLTNDSSALLYIKFGTTASTTSYTVVLAGAASAPFSYFEVPSGYTGRIDGIWASAAGNARITEMT